MKIKKAIINFFCFGSLFYTAITSVLLVVALSLAEENAVKLIEIPQFLKILLFSFILSLGSTLIRIEAIPRVAAVCAHAGCYIAGWLVFITLCGATFATTTISTLVFAILYTIVTVIIKVCSKKTPSKKTIAEVVTPEKKKNSKSSYTSQFHK